MNANLTLLCKSDLEEIKFKALSDVYNAFAKELDLKSIKKFKDKTTGIKRIVAIQEQYSEAVFAIIDKAVDKAFAKDLKDTDFNTRIEQAANIASEKEIAYQIGTVKPKSESSAMGIIYKFVEECGSVSLEGLCEHFLSEYALQYKGKAELNTSFAKGYIKGAVRASNIIAV